MSEYDDLFDWADSFDPPSSGKAVSTKVASVESGEESGEESEKESEEESGEEFVRVSDGESDSIRQRGISVSCEDDGDEDEFEEKQGRVDKEIEALFALDTSEEWSEDEYTETDEDQEEEELRTVDEEEQRKRDKREMSQVRQWLREVNNDLKNCLSELKKIRIRQGSPWYRRETVLFYKKAMDIAGRIANILNSGMGIKTGRFSSEVLRDIYFHFYGMMIRYAKPMCESLPGKDDRISTAPIYYFFNTCCFIQVYLYESGSLNVWMFDQPADSNPYCLKHTLFINRDIPIDNYNVEMLCTALHQLEMFWRTLPISDDLHQYLAALELCFSFLICYTHDANTHNVKELRVDAGVDGEYYPTKELVFEMAVRFTALYEETGSTRELRAHMTEPTQLMKLIWPTARDVERVKRSLIREAKKVHSDSYTDKVRKDRQKMAIYPSECYLFFKENPTVQELEPQKVFDTFRPDVAWRDLCDNYANVKPEDMFERCTDPLGVRVALPALMEIICTQDLKRTWEDFSTLSPAFITGDTGALVTSLLKNSETVPLYVTCMNDVYILFRGQCYCFGASCEAHLQAMVYWINIVQYLCDGQVGSTPFRDFYITMMGEECRNEVLQPPDMTIPFFDNDLDDDEDAMTRDTSRVECLIDEDVFFGRASGHVEDQSGDEQEEIEDSDDDNDDSDDDGDTESTDIASDDDDAGNWGDIF